MTLRLPLACVALTVALCAVAVTPAVAADSDVRSAWNSTKERFVKQQKAAGKAARRFALRGFDRPAPLLRAIGRVRRTIDLTQRRVRAQEPSTASGMSAKDYVLRSLSSYQRAYRLQRKATRQVAAGLKRGFGTFRRAGSKLKQAKRQAATARSLFEQAEDEPPLPPAPTP